MGKKMRRVFVTTAGDYITLVDIEKIRRLPFDEEDASISVLRGEPVPAYALWAKTKAGSEIIAIDLSNNFNLDTLKVEHQSRHYGQPTQEEEAERRIVERWCKVNQKKKKKRLAKK